MPTRCKISDIFSWHVLVWKKWQIIHVVWSYLDDFILTEIKQINSRLPTMRISILKIVCVRSIVHLEQVEYDGPLAKNNTSNLWTSQIRASKLCFKLQISFWRPNLVRVKIIFFFSKKTLGCNLSPSGFVNYRSGSWEHQSISLDLNKATHHQDYSYSETTVSWIVSVGMVGLTGARPLLLSRSWVSFSVCVIVESFTVVGFVIIRPPVTQAGSLHPKAYKVYKQSDHI